MADAQERLDVLQGMTLLSVTAEASDLAKELVRAGALPANAADDAVPCCHCGCERRTISVDVELPPSSECSDATTDRSRLHEKWAEGTDYLHSRRTLGGETMNDPIVDEIRRIRDAHAARFNYDIRAIVRDLQEKQKRSGRKYVSYPPIRIEPKPALPAATSVPPAAEVPAPQ